MKTVAIVISKDIIRRNILDTNFWPIFLKQTKGTRKVLIVEEGKKEDYKIRFPGEHIEIVEYTKTSWRGWQRVLLFLIRTGLRSRSTTFHRWYTHTQGRAGLAITLFKSFLSIVFGSATWYKRLLRLLLLRAAAPKPVLEIFDTYIPDLVFAPSLIDIDVDVPIVLEARRRGVRTVGMVRSWDNLNHHYVLPFVPDHFIFQNEWLKEAVQTFQNVNIKKIETSVVGLPHYDIYFDPSSMIKERKVFFENMGLDPEKKMLFLGGSEYYHSEESLLNLLNNAIEAGEIGEPSQVLYRIHPSSMYSAEDLKLDTLKHVILDGAFVRSVGPKFTDTDRFVNMLYHADVTMSIGSTLAIDGAAFHRPAIAIDYDDPKKKLSYWESVHRFNDHFDHQRHLIATRGVRTPRVADDVISDINGYLLNPKKDEEGRKKILEQFVEPFDGKAGERLGNILVEELKNV